jgi:hypothetical protein
MQTNDFNYWAVIELFGHEKYAGKVSVQKVGESTMIMLEVPETPKSETLGMYLPGFVKFINHSSVFSITPVDEEYAKGMAATLKKQPVAGYEHKEVITALAKKVTSEMTLAEINKLLLKGTVMIADEAVEEFEL